jgi:hypothetical protein
MQLLHLIRTKTESAEGIRQNEEKYGPSHEVHMQANTTTKHRSGLLFSYFQYHYHKKVSEYKWGRKGPKCSYMTRSEIVRAGFDTVWRWVHILVFGKERQTGITGLTNQNRSAPWWLVLKHSIVRLVAPCVVWDVASETVLIYQDSSQNTNTSPSMSNLVTPQEWSEPVTLVSVLSLSCAMSMPVSVRVLVHPQSVCLALYCYHANNNISSLQALNFGTRTSITRIAVSIRAWRAHSVSEHYWMVNMHFKSSFFS